MSSSRTQAKSKAPARSSSKASAHPPAGPRLMSERTTDTGGTDEPPEPGGLRAPRAVRFTGGVLALSTTTIAPGAAVCAAMASRHLASARGALCDRTRATTECRSSCPDGGSPVAPAVTEGTGSVAAPMAGSVTGVVRSPTSRR